MLSNHKKYPSNAQYDMCRIFVDYIKGWKYRLNIQVWTGCDIRIDNDGPYIAQMLFYEDRVEISRIKTAPPYDNIQKLEIEYSNPNMLDDTIACVLNITDNCPLPDNLKFV